MLKSPAVLIALAGLLILTGCKQPTGRVEIGQTTKAERKSSRVQPAALIEFSDQVPRDLLQDLGVSPKLAGVDRPIVVLMGDLNNQTTRVGTEEFELVQSRIRSNLINSSAQSQFVFLERRARVSRLAEREGVVNESTGTSQRAQLVGEATYLLSGDFYSVTRGDTNLYYMEFQLVNIASTELVFSNKYEIKQTK